MKRLGAAIALVAGCAGQAPPPPVAPPPPPANAAEPAPVDEPPQPPPAPPTEVVYEGARARRLERLTRVARGVVDAFGNVSPQPVVRGYTEVPHVQFQTDRREPGAMRWVESPTAALHHAVAVAAKVEPCARPLAPGGEARLGDVLVRLVRGDDHDEVRVGEKKVIVAKLPRGASHGACVDGEGTRVWLSWSTPTSPPELFSISRRDVVTRPLRLDARPGLSLLGDARASEVAGLAIVEPTTHAVATAIVVDDDRAPRARWNPLARFLADAGIATLITPRETLAVALEHARGPVTIVVRRAAGLVAASAPVVLLGETPEAFEGAVPAGALIVAAGPDLADAARAAATRADGRLVIAPGAKRRDALAAAYARVADAILPAP